MASPEVDGATDPVLAAAIAASNLRDGAGKYADVLGFSKTSVIEEVRGHGHVLTPGRYVGAPDAEDDEPLRREAQAPRD